MKTRYLAAFAACALAASGAQAAPLVATHSVSGAAGNYTYNFTITNNIGQGQAVYFIGLQDDTGTASGAPGYFDRYIAWSFAGMAHNVTWLDRYTPGILDGQTLSGFKITDTSATVKDSFSFSAYSINGNTTYTGGENVGGKPYFNPVFRFTSTSAVAAVPEPATWAMMLVGFGMVSATTRYRRRSAKIAYA